MTRDQINQLVRGAKSARVRRWFDSRACKPINQPKRNRGLIRGCLVRWHRVTELIASGTFPSVAVIAAELEVSDKTIYRDIDYLRDFFGHELEYNPIEYGWYYVKPPDHIITMGKKLTADYLLQADN